jgi:hypothetical protein
VTQAIAGFNGPVTTTVLPQVDAPKPAHQQLVQTTEKVIKQSREHVSSQQLAAMTAKVE